MADTIYDRLRAAGLIQGDEPPMPYSGPAHMRSDRAAAYAERALAGECENVASAPEGTRNHTLNRAGWKIGRLVADGHLDGDRALAALADAARSTGLSSGEAMKTARHALGDGQAKQYRPTSAVQLDDEQLVEDVQAESLMGKMILSPGPSQRAKVQDEDQFQEDPEPVSDEEAWRRAVEQEAMRLRVRDEARQYENARRAGNLTIPELTRLDDFLSIDDEPVSYRIDGLMPTGAHIMLAAQFKAGKTTAVGNAMRSLVDGDPFMNAFMVPEPVESVVLIDDEMSERQLRMWLREQGIKNVGGVHVVSLRGRVSTFDLINESVRERWVDRIRAAGCQVLVFDCLRPVLDALGLSEDKEAGRFLVAFDALLAEAGVPEAVMVHHMGHGGERSRGDSRLRDWPDVEWRLVRDVPPGEEDPAAERFFTAFGRDVAVPEGRVLMDETTRHLTFEPDVDRKTRRRERERTADPEGWPTIRKYLEGGCHATQRDLVRALGVEGISEWTARKTIERLVSQGRLTVESGPGKALIHRLAEERS